MHLFDSDPRANPRSLSESKPQVWRALAALDDGSESLLCLGRSTVQVRAAYAAAFAGLFGPEDRGRVRRIILQRWQGAADRGRWADDSPLSVPSDAAA